MPGSNPLVDRAVERKDAMDDFLRQSMDEVAAAGDNWAALSAITGVAS